MNTELDIPKVEIIGVTGIPEVHSGFPIGLEITKACSKGGISLDDGDVVVVTQKIVSKSEGRIVCLNNVLPTYDAIEFAAVSGRDSRLIQLVLNESKSIVRKDTQRGILITETHHGFICANSGIDTSNVPGEDMASLLPKDPDVSARRIMEEIKNGAKGPSVGVVISDTFGRAWREGHINHAIGLAGINAFKDYRGIYDAVGKMMSATMIAYVDELASAAELVMAKTSGVPVAIVKGYEFQPGDQGLRSLLRAKADDLFR